MKSLRLRNAVLVGCVPALLECVLLLAAEPTILPWILAQSVLFWFFCGAVTYLAESGLPDIAHSVAITVALNIPWYIALAIIPNKFEHLAPLVVSSVILGGIIGLLRRKLKRGELNTAAVA